MGWAEINQRIQTAKNTSRTILPKLCILFSPISILNCMQYVLFLFYSKLFYLQFSVRNSAENSCPWINLRGLFGTVRGVNSGQNIDRLFSLNPPLWSLQFNWCHIAYHNHMQEAQQSPPEPPSTQKKWEEGVGEGKLCYQSRASKTISDISWVICDPAFFLLQRAAVYGGGFEDRGEMESDFSDKGWHRACLILESENILICCHLWKLFWWPSLYGLISDGFFHPQTTVWTSDAELVVTDL